MALSQAAIQKKKLKKQQKRKSALKHKLQNAHTSQQIPLVQRGQLYECLVAHNISPTGGLWHITVSRIIDDIGTIIVADFLVDTYFSGVEHVFVHEENEVSYRNVLSKLQNETGIVLQHVEPSFVKKLIIGAVAHAKSLEVSPHPEYNRAKGIFADVDETTCNVTFSYGL